MAVKRKKILIVEDEESLLRLESIILTSKGYDVIGVADGIAAIEQISRSIPDLVILDVMLPDMDGLEVCRKIKNDPFTSKVPVIMLTARKGSKDMERGLEAGADAYMTKPFKSAQLIDMIENTLSKMPV